jgi:uncharacterized protein YukE
MDTLHELTAVLQQVQQGVQAQHGATTAVQDRTAQAGERLADALTRLADAIEALASRTGRR